MLSLMIDDKITLSVGPCTSQYSLYPMPWGECVGSGVNYVPQGHGILAYRSWTMMVLWHRNTFCITGPLWGESISDHDCVITWKHFLYYWPFVRGIQWSLLDSPHKGPSNAELRCFLCCWPEQALKQTVEYLVKWDVMMLMWHHSNIRENFTYVLTKNWMWINILHGKLWRSDLNKAKFSGAFLQAMFFEKRYPVFFVISEACAWRVGLNTDTGEWC